MNSGTRIAIGVVVGGGALALASWLVYRLRDINKGTPYEGSGAVGTVGNVTNQLLGGVPQKLGEALGSGLYNVFHGDDDLGDDYFYTFTLPDGSRGSIGASFVGSDGRFTYKGSTYVMVDDKNGKHFAVRP